MVIFFFFKNIFGKFVERRVSARFRIDKLKLDTVPFWNLRINGRAGARTRFTQDKRYVWIFKHYRRSELESTWQFLVRWKIRKSIQLCS